MKAYAKLFSSILTLSLNILAGCAKNPTVTDLWMDEAHDGKQYGKILVIGAAEKLIWSMTSESEIRYNFKFLSFAATLVINKLRDDDLI